MASPARHTPPAISLLRALGFLLSCGAHWAHGAILHMWAFLIPQRPAFFLVLMANLSLYFFFLVWLFSLFLLQIFSFFFSTIPFRSSTKSAGFKKDSWACFPNPLFKKPIYSRGGTLDYRMLHPPPPDFTFFQACSYLRVFFLRFWFSVFAFGTPLWPKELLKPFSFWGSNSRAHSSFAPGAAIVRP